MHGKQPKHKDVEYCFKNSLSETTDDTFTFDPLSPNNNKHVLLIALHIVRKVLVGRICINIQTSRQFIVGNHLLYSHDLDV